MKPVVKCTLAVLAVAASVLPLRAELTPVEILREADKARGNLEGITWRVAVVAVENSRTTTMDFQVKARGHNFLADTLAPPRRKGNKLLFREGNMWFHKPDLSKPAPISQRQKLLGKAAYGDIAATNYSQDYEAHPLPDEVINGENCYVFDLRAKTKRNTYNRIVYWISKDRLVGIKADYYTVSGRKFKSAIMKYEHEIPAEDGGQRPFCSKIIITDELVSSDSTVLRLSAPNLEPVPYTAFDLNLLIR